MNFDAAFFGVLVSIVLPGIGVIVWTIRQEGRINLHEALFADAKKRLEIIEGELERRRSNSDDFAGHDNRRKP